WDGLLREGGSQRIALHAREHGRSQKCAGTRERLRGRVTPGEGRGHDLPQFTNPATGRSRTHRDSEHRSGEEKLLIVAVRLRLDPFERSAPVLVLNPEMSRELPLCEDPPSRAVAAGAEPVQYGRSIPYLKKCSKCRLRR